MKRRDFISLVSSAAAWPITARGQAGLPVVGYLNSGLPQHADELLAFHKGLGEFGYVDSRNVAVEARWANNELSRRRPTF